MVGERERQAEQTGGVGAVVARTEQPHLRPVAGGGGGDDLRVRAGEVVEEVAQLRGELVADLAGVAAEGRRGDRIGARRPAEAQVDAAGVERLECAELFGHGERGVVGEHHPAGADAQRGGGVGEVGDQHRRRRAGDAGHVVVFGHPVPGVAEALDVLGELDRVRQCLGGGRAGRHRSEIEHGQADFVGAIGE